MRLDQERQKRLEPRRLKHAKAKLIELGYEIEYEDDTKIQFMHKGNKITLFPYSGWHTGKGIKDGRGLQVLLNQLKKP